MELKTIDISTVLYNEDGRGKISKESVKELAESIKLIGLIQPIVIRKDKTILAGRRRFKACESLGMKKIEVLIVEADEELSYQIKLSENIHRKDLTPFQLAEEIKQLSKEQGLKPHDIALKIGKSQYYITQIASLTNLSKEFVYWKDNASVDISALIEISKYPEDVQLSIRLEFNEDDDWKNYTEILTGADIKNYADQHILRNLNNVPWDLNDPDLVVKKPCNGCQERTDANIFLFEDMKTPKKLCMNDNCFRGKLLTFKSRAIVRAFEDGKLKSSIEKTRVWCLSDYYGRKLEDLIAVGYPALPEDRKLLLGNEFTTKKQPKAIPAQVGIWIDPSDSKLIGKTQEFWLTQHIRQYEEAKEAAKKGDKKKAKELGKEIVGTVAENVDKHFWRRTDINVFNSKHVGYLKAIKEGFSLLQNPVGFDYDNAKQLVYTMMDFMGFNFQSKLEGIFGEKIKDKDVRLHVMTFFDSIAKKNLEKLLTLGWMMMILEKTSTFNSESFVKGFEEKYDPYDVNEATLKMLMTKCKIKSEPYLIESDKEFLPERNKMYENFKKNHKREPLSRKKLGID